MHFKDYYSILGIERDATQQEVKRAYRKLARKYHPDVSKETDAEERFKEVGEAYEVIKDPEKRAAYDELGANWQAGQDFKPPPNWDAGFEFSGGGYTHADEKVFSEFFESLFGQQFNRTQNEQRYGQYYGGVEDHHAKVLIEIEDAYRGVERDIFLRSPVIDSNGQVVNKERKLRVKIPKGIRQGQKIRLAGQGGGAGHAHTAGDLYLEIEFAPHPVFSVDGRDVYLKLPVTPWEAALGATITIPTPVTQLDLKIPKNSCTDKKLRLRGQGLPGDPPGDIFVTLQISLPPADSESAVAIYEAMADKMAFNPRASLGV